MSKTTTKISQGILFLLGIFIFLLLFVLLVNYFVKTSVKGQIFDSVSAIPAREYAVVLGTARELKNSQEEFEYNPFYMNRLNAAKDLYDAKKVRKFLLTGSNEEIGYDESLDMQKDLVAMGLDSQLMVMDKAGLRTLDSIVRAKNVFGVDHYTIVSQRFHCERALFIANFYDIDAICYAAEDVNQSLTVRVREYLAKVWMMFDLLCNRQPKYPE
ncbi:SanA protein [Neisseriaceae bacterium PsAf]|nr:SanA protein [Neisseriaceae bacterium PsAf]